MHFGRRARSRFGKGREERLIEFSVLIIEIVNEIPNSKTGNHLSGQLVRSGTSVSLNYGEAQSGESRKDFIYPVR
ncbi:four helix bundle protein [bacterium]|nr:four helix bundle protein [bacterium]